MAPATVGMVSSRPSGSATRAKMSARMPADAGTTKEADRAVLAVMTVKMAAPIASEVNSQCIHSASANCPNSGNPTAITGRMAQ